MKPRAKPRSAQPVPPAEPSPTPDPAPQTEHLGATEAAVAPISAPQSDAEEAAADIDPADELTPG